MINQIKCKIKYTKKNKKRIIKILKAIKAHKNINTLRHYSDYIPVCITTNSHIYPHTFIYNNGSSKIK